MSKSATQLMTTFFDAPTAMCCTPFFASSLINPIDTPTCTHHRYSDAQAQDHTNDCCPAVFQHMREGPYGRLEYILLCANRNHHWLDNQPSLQGNLCGWDTSALQEFSDVSIAPLSAGGQSCQCRPDSQSIKSQSFKRDVCASQQVVHGCMPQVNEVSSHTTSAAPHGALLATGSRVA